MHTAMQTTILRRRMMAEAGETPAMDQMEATIRDLFIRAGVAHDQFSSKEFRVGLVSFLHALVVRATTMAMYDMVPANAPRAVAEVAAEVATVVVGDFSLSDLMDALLIATTEEIGVGIEVA
jgi:uncharacterized membrane protein